ncbi:DNA polymerase epsilon subunit 3-like [Homarus americanus]|uniref:DNA polymerase epsilon subunit 3 n=1 Tax=Homarus americanus TaxID=6706 RepID=A0A8J5K5W4_HOMAM|nr:DNA polymerase epsilon subunit 3-like [Homarus americanus]XP_042217678.1 DNA polymerase epsilon subunit 3-like [Homarus americanus]XP_042217679.1 DNA polymerase epsilon subunit 3-like [Homarus americanus]XP_042217680.1 DNA polymerase epsilon subunit 3-like [Homarus americanus]XP_042217681.1 DNA polymerase epsilon subunit 3-like [Homarus americanus]KAG7171257.1 DNA polymerase epsilon subunit 3-like [Homarus americanus]
MAERPEDLNLPNAVITRIIKDALPDGIAVAKEARSAIAKAASVFVLYTTSTANSLAQKNKKKTVSAQDVFAAMKEMEFDKFIEPLQESLEVHKKSQQSKKEQKEAKAKAKKAEESEKNTSMAEVVLMDASHTCTEIGVELQNTETMD